MKAAFDIPDNVYRSVKARGAIEGRPLRSIAVELFQNWLQAPTSPPLAAKNDATPEKLTKYPWLAISKRFVKPEVSHDMENIRESIARGWETEAAEKLTRKPARS